MNTQSHPIKISNDAKQGHLRGGFGIEILFPGQVRGGDDSGIGTIGRIDHAKIRPGVRVPMHPHQDDEILTYLRSGAVQHTDSEGLNEEFSNKRLMLMSAGRRFQHEELVLEKGGDVEALQIFVRPLEAGLEPMVQFHDFPTSHSDDEWRLVAGPTEGAPLRFRSETWVQDMRLAAGETATLPEAPIPGTARLLYLFNGAATVNGDQALIKGESLLIADHTLSIVASETADLVLFTTDESAPVYRGGMFSGNVANK